jgi:hypothetical protein
MSTVGSNLSGFRVSPGNGSLVPRIVCRAGALVLGASALKPVRKVVPVGGNLLEEIDVPDAVRTAVHTASQAARAAERSFTATKGFFDALRERR